VQWEKLCGRVLGYEARRETLLAQHQAREEECRGLEERVMSLDAALPWKQPGLGFLRRAYEWVVHYDMEPVLEASREWSRGLRDRDRLKEEVASLERLQYEEVENYLILQKDADARYDALREQQVQLTLSSDRMETCSRTAESALLWLRRCSQSLALGDGPDDMMMRWKVVETNEVMKTLRKYDAGNLRDAVPEVAERIAELAAACPDIDGTTSSVRECSARVQALRDAVADGMRELYEKRQVVRAQLSVACQDMLERIRDGIV